MAGDDEKEVRTVEEASPSEVAEGSEETAKVAGEEEDTGAQIAPIVKLEEVAISTGEENEDVLLDMKAKLYRFDKDGTQWKERGVGQVKILEHKSTKKVRLLMRQNRTLKICANHMVTAATQLQEHAGSDKTWVWHARDYSDGELKEELFCMRFGSVESAQKFKDVYEAAQDKVEGKPEEEDEHADEAAELLDKLKVESKTEGAADTDEKEKAKPAVEEKEATEAKAE
jgi:Ran-binding protein 1